MPVTLKVKIFWRFSCPLAVRPFAVVSSQLSSKTHVRLCKYVRLGGERKDRSVMAGCVECGREWQSVNLSTAQRKPIKQTFHVNFLVCEKNFRMFELPDNHHTDKWQLASLYGLNYSSSLNSGSRKSKHHINCKEASMHFSQATGKFVCWKNYFRRRLYEYFNS